MTKEELIEFLRENLRIQVDITVDADHSTCYVTVDSEIFLGEESISSSSSYAALPQ